MEVTDFIVSQGGYIETMFVVTAEGNLWRRKNDPSDPGAFGCYGAVNNPTPERCKELLQRLRNARPDRPNHRTFATVKQTREILEKFNAGE